MAANEEIFELRPSDAAVLTRPPSFLCHLRAHHVGDPMAPAGPDAVWAAVADADTFASALQAGAVPPDAVELVHWRPTEALRSLYGALNGHCGISVLNPSALELSSLQPRDRAEGAADRDPWHLHRHAKRDREGGDDYRRRRH